MIVKTLAFSLRSESKMSGTNTIWSFVHIELKLRCKDLTFNPISLQDITTLNLSKKVVSSLIDYKVRTESVFPSISTTTTRSYVGRARDNE